MMYVVLVHYSDRDRVAEQRPLHLEWIRKRSADGTLLFTGRRTAPEGGMMIAQADSHEDMLEILKGDPYATSGAATHELIEFDPRGGSLFPSLRP
jgi:uncharacterized protein YciI